MDEKQYQKGFNAGYLLGKLDPVLLEKFKKIEGAQDFLAGFKAGAKQAEKELFIAKMQQARDNARGLELD